MKALDSFAKMKVLDSSGIINARDRELSGRYVTVPEVKKELKDIQSRLKFEAALADGKITLDEPSSKFLKETKAAAEKSGVLSMLSDTDLRVIALALENKLPILTDDYDVQNMCKILGLGFETVVMPGIKKQLSWTKKCTACGKIYTTDVVECEACGSSKFSVSRT